MKITLVLDLNDVNAILSVLAKLPYEQVESLISNIRGQAQAQVTPPPPPPP